MSNEEILQKIKCVEMTMLAKISEIKNSKHNFNGSMTIVEPFTFSPCSDLIYNENQIGYNFELSIESDLDLLSDIEYEILTLNLPCNGVWLINYRIELFFSLGFTCFRNSKINLCTRSKCILENINTIFSININSVTVSDTFVYKGNELQLHLNCIFSFGRLFNNGVFKIIKNENFPILKITRIC